MIAALMTHLSGGALVASTSGPTWLLVLGPAAGGGLYYSRWQFYRNTPKSHSFETETSVTAQPVTGTDQKVDEVHGTSQSNISGDNVTDHRRRVQRLP